MGHIYLSQESVLRYETMLSCVWHTQKSLLCWDEGLFQVFVKMYVFRKIIRNNSDYFCIFAANY